MKDLVRLINSLREFDEKKLELALQKNGKLINAEGIVNLVPLNKSAEVGDVDAVRARLSAGIDPHEISPSP